jgi:molybdopterin-guanine dinucleotide biosynthesis protein A
MPTQSATPRPTIAAAILAGGRARRMGGVNKETLRIDGVRIVDRQLAVLRQVADPIFVVSNDPDRFADLDLRVVPDAIPDAGALGGIYAAIVASPRPRTMVVACDMPFLSVMLLQRLARESSADLVIPRSERGYEPLCAAWSARAAPVLRRRIESGLLTVAAAVEDLQVEAVGPEFLASCDPRGLLFVNVNTLHDYERVRELGRVESEP